MEFARDKLRPIVFDGKPFVLDFDAVDICTQSYTCDAPPITGEGEGEGERPCSEVTSTLVLHQYAIPARVENVSTIVAPVFAVIGSGELVAATVNPYLDNVTLHTTAEGFALGACD